MAVLDITKKCYCRHESVTIRTAFPATGLGFQEMSVSFEIERRFLLRGDDWRQTAAKKTDIRQAYLAFDGRASVRVRISNNSSATLTVKSRPAKLRRLEVEYVIPILEAEALIALRQGFVVEKVRYEVPYRDLTWEIDVFSGENVGLVIAEIELRHEQQRIDLPPWIGEEVTGQRQYYNGALAQRPFHSWSHCGDLVKMRA
jgi:adenylate cyclase